MACQDQRWVSAGRRRDVGLPRRRGRVERRAGHAANPLQPRIPDKAHGGDGNFASRRSGAAVPGGFRRRPCPRTSTRFLGPERDGAGPPRQSRGPSTSLSNGVRFFRHHSDWDDEALSRLVAEVATDSAGFARHFWLSERGLVRARPRDRDRDRYSLGGSHAAVPVRRRWDGQDHLRDRSRCGAARHGSHDRR